MADEFSFLDSSTGLPVKIETGAEDLFLQGKIGVRKGSEVPVFDTEENKVVGLPFDQTEEAIRSGRWRFLNPEESAIDTYKQTIRNESVGSAIAGGAKRFGTQVVDEFLLGAPEAAADAYQGYDKFDEKTGQLTDFGRRSVDAEERPVANIAGGLTGLGLSLYYGGPAFKALGVLGEGAAKVTTKAAEKLIASELAQKTLAKGVGLAAEGAGIAALPVGARHAGAVLGDQETVGEALVAGAGDLATMGVFNVGLGAGIRGASSGLGLMGSVIKAASSPRASAALNEMADTANLKQYGWLTSQFRSASKNEGRILETPLVADLEDEAGSLLINALETGGEKALNRKIIEGMGKYIKVSDTVPRFKKAEVALQGLDEANGKLLQERNNLINQIDTAIPKGVISETSLLSEMKKYRDGLVSKRGAGFAENAGLADAEKMMQATQDYFQSRRAVAGNVAAETLQFKEAESLRKLLGEMGYTQTAVPGGFSRGAKSEAATGMYATVKNHFVDRVKQAEAAGQIEKGIAESYLNSGKKISEVILYKDLMKSAAEVNQANAVISPFDILAGSAGAIGAGGVGVLAGGAGAFIKRQYGNVLAEKSLRSMANIIDNVGAKVDSSIDALLGVGERAKPATKLASITLFDRYFNGESKKEKSDELKAFTNDLARLQADPKLLADVSSAVLKPFIDADPMIATSMQVQMNTAVNYLLKEAPKATHPENGLTPNKFIPTDSQLNRYKRQVEAAFNPQSVLDDMAHGVATPEQFQALKAVYPKLFKSIQSRAMSKMATLGVKPSFNARLKLRYLLEEPMGINISKQNVQILQNNFSPSDKKPTPRANSKITESSRGQTDIERIIGN